MIYAYDLNIQYPVKDLYDSLTIAMSIAAAKDMYEKGQLEIKEFKKEFGDFYSPFLKDMQRYGEMIQGVKDVVNNLYANGIDPIRNPQGRAIISRAISNIDPGEFNNMRANARTGLAYQEAMQKLLALGKYDPAMQEYYLRSQGLPSFLDFSSAGGNTWTQTSPMEAVSLRDLTTAGFAHRTPHELTKEQALKWMGKSYDPRAKYKGWTYDDLYNTAGTLVPGLRGDWRAEYFKDLSRQRALAQNPNATQADVDRQFLADIAEANRQWIVDPIGDLSDYYQQENLNINKQKLAVARQRAALTAKTAGGDHTGWTGRLLTDILANFNRNKDAVLNDKNFSVSKYYGLLQTKPQGSDRTSALAYASGVNNPELIDVGLSTKRLTVQFGGGDMHLTKKRLYDYAKDIPGSGRIQKFGPVVFNSPGKAVDKLTEKLAYKFNNWLHANHISGYIPSNDVSVNYNTDGNQDYFDVNSFMRVKANDIKDFFGNQPLETLGSKLGLVIVKKPGKKVLQSGKNKGKLMWDDIDYVDVPFTRTIGGGVYGNSELDVYHDMKTLGKSVAAKRESSYEGRDLDDLEY